MTRPAVTEVTLRALAGTPLDDEGVARMVVATAHAIAERQGITVRDVDTTPASITITIEGGRIEAIGLGAELRRLTTRWYTSKYGEATLWGDPPTIADDEDWTGG